MRICILGATGLVGRETLTLVARAWPNAELHLFASRDQTMVHDGRELEVHGASRLETTDAPRGDLALVALDDDHSARYVPRLLELGYRVVDKSNTYRLDPGVPLVVAGVNCRELSDRVRLVANPNCTTIPFCLAVGPLGQRFGLESATIATYQAVSGAGIGALDHFLDASQAGYGEPDRLGLPFDPGGYAGNTFPHHGKTDDSGFSSEERKLVQESHKILASAPIAPGGREVNQFAVSAQCSRVAVAVGHTVVAWVRLGQRATIERIGEALTGAPFVTFVPGATGEGVTPLHCVRNRDRAIVGRLRLDARDPEGRTICLTAVADNLRLGAATNAVRMASRWFASADPDLGVPTDKAA